MSVDEQIVESSGVPERNSLRAVVASICWTSASTIFLVGAAFVLNLIIGNVFGDEGLGIYSLATAIYLFVGTVAGLGQYFALVKYTAEHIDEQQIGNEYFGASLVIVGTAGVFLGGGLFILRDDLARLFSMPDLEGFLGVLAGAVPLFELNKVALARLAGLRRMKAFAVGESLRYIIVLLMTIAGIIWDPENLHLAVWALFIAEVLLAVYMAWITNLHHCTSLRNFMARARELLRFGIQVVSLRIIGEMDSRLDLAVTGYFLSQGEVGVYSVGLMLARGLTIFPNALQKVAMPLMTEHYAKERLPALENFVNRAMQAAAVVLTMAAIVMAVFFSQIVSFLYPGQEVFLSGRPAFNVLLVGFVFRGVGLTVASIFASIGRPDVELKTAPITFGTNLVIAVVLASIGWGMPGIAAGAAISGIVAFALWTGLIRPIVGIKVHYWPLLIVPILGLGATLLILSAASYVPVLPLTVLVIVLLCLAALRLYRFDRLVAHLLRP